MKKTLSCKDMGADCDFAICAETEQELFRKAADHAKEAHQMSEIPKDLYDKARSVIHEVENC